MASITINQAHTVKNQRIYMIMFVMLSLTMIRCQAIALRVGQLTGVHVYTQILKGPSQLLDTESET